MQLVPAMSDCALLLATQHVGARGSAYVLRLLQHGATYTLAMVYAKAIHIPRTRSVMCVNYGPGSLSGDSYRHEFMHV